MACHFVVVVVKWESLKHSLNQVQIGPMLLLILVPLDGLISLVYTMLLPQISVDFKLYTYSLIFTLD